MKYFILILTISLLYSCSSGIDPDLLAQIENRTELTDDLFDRYEELNEELMEVIVEQDYAYKKLIKTRNALRQVNSRIISRKKRLQMSQGPTTSPEKNEDKEAESKESENNEAEQPQPQANPSTAAHQERLSQYTEEQAELQAESDEWLAQTREHTAKALQLRTARNRAYDEYTKSRQALKELNKKAGQTN